MGLGTNSPKFSDPHFKLDALALWKNFLVRMKDRRLVFLLGNIPVSAV